MFGKAGLLGQIREAQEELQEAANRRVAANGPPLHGERRRLERKALRDAKIQAMLEERAARQEAEKAEEQGWV